MRTPRSLLGAIALLGIAALPLMAERLRPRVERCSMDGVAVVPSFRVRAGEHVFCGVTCAEAWLARSGVAPDGIRVTDCVTGREIAAPEAWFVRTLGNRSDGAPDAIRVFAGRKEAEGHVEAYGGTILVGALRPFAGGEERATKDR